MRAIAAYYHSLRYQSRRQILARLRHELAWRLYPRPRPDAEWNPPGQSLLERFQLHYFDSAPGSERAALERRIENWIASNPPGSFPGWHPYPTSLRIVNWIRALGPQMPVRASDSLASQAAFLERHLEYHLGGNHLLENARALLAAGLYFDGPAAARWTTKALELLRRELSHQVLPDGGHFERSPYYHVLMTRLVSDVVDLLDARGNAVPPEIASAAHRMTVFARALRHQDGGLPCFHDGLAGDRAEPSAADLPRSFPDSGYYILEGPQGRLIADYGAPGSHPNPGHQHAGIFSLEISAGGRRVIVDSGTETYDPGPRRDRLRSTAAHNTVSVDGRDQFELWGAFRVGRRAWVSAVRERREARFEAISSAHNGYARLAVEHRRTIVSLAGAGWLIVDDVAGRGSHRLESFLHLGPGITPVIDRDRVCLLPLGWILLPFGATQPPEALDDVCSPTLGRIEPSRTLRLESSGDLPRRFGYFLGPLASARLAFDGADRFRIEAPPLAIALRIEKNVFDSLEVEYNDSSDAT